MPITITSDNPKIFSNIQGKPIFSKFLFRKANNDKLRVELSQVAWPEYDGDVEESVLHFIKILQYLFYKRVPQCKSTCKSENPKWFNAE